MVRGRLLTFQPGARRWQTGSEPCGDQRLSCLASKGGSDDCSALFSPSTGQRGPRVEVEQWCKRVPRSGLGSNTRADLHVSSSL